MMTRCCGLQDEIEMEGSIFRKPRTIVSQSVTHSGIRTEKNTVTMQIATAADVPDIVALRAAVAAKLTTEYGKGPWTSVSSEKAVRYDMRTSKVFILRQKSRLVATLRLTSKKPWAIDPSYFTKCNRPLYLLSMAVTPDLQRCGIGRSCIEEVKQICRQWPADALRLDAHDTPAGAGQFYFKCGFQNVGQTSYRSCPLEYFEMAL
jgi:GNAT superfamily N-acetyltransferase